MNRNQTTLGNIAEIITGPFGSSLHMSDYVEVGNPVIMPQNIGNRVVDEGNIARISDDDFIRLKRYATKKEDLVFSRRGDVEKHALITNNDKMLCGTGCLRVRVTKNDVYPLYLSFFLSKPASKKWLSTHAVGSNMPNLNTDILASVPVDYPSYDEQVRLANTLQTLDCKIAVNQRINDNLQQMAYTTYMHLFFKRNPNGTLGEIIEENAKSNVQVGEAKGRSGRFPFFTSGDAIYEWNDSMVDGRNCYLNTGGNAGIKYYIGKAAYSTDTWCITGKYNLEDYLYLMLLSLKPELSQKFFQGTGLKHLQKPLLKARRIYIPTKNEISNFNATVQPMMDMISANTRENQNLTKLRDWLLPMLMNGQATVSN